jgi:hypothetical protein
MKLNVATEVAGRSDRLRNEMFFRVYKKAYKSKPIG